MTKFKVAADATEITAFLRGAFTEEELKLIVIKAEGVGSPLLSQSHAGLSR